MLNGYSRPMRYYFGVFLLLVFYINAAAQDKTCGCANDSTAYIMPIAIGKSLKTIPFFAGNTIGQRMASPRKSKRKTDAYLRHKRNTTISLPAWL